MTLTNPPSTIDLIVRAGTVLTMHPRDGHGLQRDAAIAIADGCIVAVGPEPEMIHQLRLDQATPSIGGPHDIVIPGLINAHQHLTGDRLLRSAIPDDIESDAAIFEWAVPSHAAHTADDDELSASLSLLEALGNGVTYTVEAGTVAHPERVLAAFDAVGVGGSLGTWGSDTVGIPFAGDVDQVIDRQVQMLALAEHHPLVDGWVTLVGHDLMSDQLISAASELARHRHTNLTFHLSPSPTDARSYMERSGARPAVHIGRLGALGPHVVIGHGVHLDDAEAAVLLEHDVALAYAPWAYLRLAQGVTQAGRHAHYRSLGGRVALACDAENAGDAIDILAAARLAAGIARDTSMDPTALGAHDALRMATIDGARAIGIDHRLGSIEVGKQADLVIIDTGGPEWHPRSPDPELQLIWASDGRAVRDVVVAGEIVLRDRRPTRIDVAPLRAEAAQRQRHVFSQISSGRAQTALRGLAAAAPSMRTTTPLQSPPRTAPRQG